MRPRLLYLSFTALALAGCAGAPAPLEQLQLSDQALDQARAVGVPEDSVELRLATDKMAQARADMADGNYKQARLNAEQAELDARLAEARMLTQKSEDQLSVGNARIERLRMQLQEAK